MNKKTIAVRHVSKNNDVRTILGQMGIVHEIPFTDGRETLSVILTYKGMKALGIDLNRVFKGCGGREIFNEETDVRNGLLVNLDLYQQVALLRAIVEKKPELANILGFYNLRGSYKVYEIFGNLPLTEIEHKYKDIIWMWTGDRFISHQVPMVDYPEEGIVILANLPSLEGKFTAKSVINSRFFGFDANAHSSEGTVIFGVQISDIPKSTNPRRPVYFD